MGNAEVWCVSNFLDEVTSVQRLAIVLIIFLKKNLLLGFCLKPSSVVLSWNYAYSSFKFVIYWSNLFSYKNWLWNKFVLKTCSAIIYFAAVRK